MDRELKALAEAAPESEGAKVLAEARALSAADEHDQAVDVYKAAFDLLRPEEDEEGEGEADGGVDEAADGGADCDEERP